MAAVSRSILRPVFACGLILFFPGKPLLSQTPTGFGRFGWTNTNGLLTLNVTPNGFSLPSACTPLKVQFGSGKATGKVLKLNPTEKILSISGGTGAPLRITYSLLYPGISASFGRKAIIRFSGKGNQPPSLAPESVSQASLVLRPRQVRGVPILVVFESGVIAAISGWKEDGATLEVTFESPTSIGVIRFVTPLGIRELANNPSKQELEQLQSACRRWTRSGIPVLISSTETVNNASNSVEFTETYKTTYGEPIAPIPPTLAFAIKNGYPAKIHGSYVSSPCRTKWGDFAYVRGNSVTYSLPIPPIDERGYIRVESDRFGEAGPLLNELVKNSSIKSNSNSLELAYAGKTNAEMAWAYLDHGIRMYLAKSWKNNLDRVLNLPHNKVQLGLWTAVTEPLTHQAYWLPRSAILPNDCRAAIAAMSHLPIYGLYKYAEYSGDWEFVRQRWQTVTRITQYLDSADDWACMTGAISNGQLGKISDAGVAEQYAGTLACLKMSRVLGDRGAEQLYAARAARRCVALVAHLWYTSWALQSGLTGKKDIVVGYDTMNGFVLTTLGEEDPWSANAFFAANGVLPEVVAAINSYASKALALFEAEFESSYPDWFRGGYIYPFKCQYQGNSVHVVFPHIYVGAILGQPDEKLWEYVQESEFNRNNAWSGPNVVAELLSRHAPLTLTEWAPAQYVDGTLASDESKVELNFRLSRPMPWRLDAIWNSHFGPRKVLINGKPVEFVLKDRRFHIEAELKGSFKVEILLNTAGQ